MGRGATGHVGHWSGSVAPSERGGLPRAKYSLVPQRCYYVCVRVHALVRACVLRGGSGGHRCGSTETPSLLDALHEQEQVGPTARGEVRAGNGGEAARRGGERRGAKAEDQVFPRGDERATQLGELRHGRVDDRLR